MDRDWNERQHYGDRWGREGNQSSQFGQTGTAGDGRDWQNQGRWMGTGSSGAANNPNWQNQGTNWQNQGNNWPNQGNNWQSQGRNWSGEGGNWQSQGRNWPNQGDNWQSQGNNWQNQGQPDDWRSTNRPSGSWNDMPNRREWSGTSSGYNPSSTGHMPGQSVRYGTMDDADYRTSRHGGSGQRDFGSSTPTVWTYTEYWLIPGPMTGRGPRGYQRSDERIREEACDRLTHHGHLDASDINVQVQNGELTLEGNVDDRNAKRLAEDAVENVPGVREVHNRLRVRAQDNQWGGSDQSRSTMTNQSGTGTQSSMMGNQPNNQASATGTSTMAPTSTAGTSSATGTSTSTTGTTRSRSGTTGSRGTETWEQARQRYQERFGQRSRSVGGTATRPWEQAEPNYRFGWEAARDSRYNNRQFNEVEPDLRRDWESRRTLTNQAGEEARWEQLREEVRDAFDMARTGD